MPMRVYRWAASALTENHLSPNHPLRLVALAVVISLYASFKREFVQTDVLDSCPDNGQATRLRREDVNLVGVLTK
jgi:hypothetical protein